ncbi:MAG TPA: 1,2-phenylacetyl-CoA epoxidase subunit PaaE [Candidatus Saccharimonadales bacterium]|nr:1,2-phenylacetyl-CoA epoxidase subunit PaaE [Candidatus Saccharimonadales bacterium]
MTATPVVEATAGHRRATIHPLRVKAVEPLTEDAVVIEFEIPPELEGEFAFTHGQHVSLRCEAAGDDTRRSYSICSAAGSGRLRVAVKRLPGGIFSGFAMEQLRAGDIIEVVTPIGHFNTPLDPHHAISYAMIAAGSGIAPILSNLTTILAVEPQSSVTLIYGNRTVRDIMFLEELEDLKNRYPERFALYHVLSREEQEVPLFHGHIDAGRLNLFLEQLVRPENIDEWLLCGPREMIESARTVLRERGVDGDHVHAELFHAKDSKPPRTAEQLALTESSGAAEVTIILDGRRSTFRVDPGGERILDAALRVRSDAPYACKGGVCGTCRAKLISGSVEMDQHFALEQREIDAGFVLACQSHPTAPKVVLDFDQ